MVGIKMATLEELLQKENEAKVLEKERKKRSKTAKTEDKEDSKLEHFEEENPEEVKSARLDTWKPYEIKDFVLPEFKIPVKKSNNYESSKREMLSKILAFIDFAQRKRFKEGCTAMAIPTTSRQNLMIWGYEKAVSRAVQFMIEIGLIAIFDDTYRFGVPYEGANYGKLYAYFKDNEDKVIQYCKDNNIQKYVVKNVETIDTEEQAEIIENLDKTKSFDISEVRFAKNLELEKPEGFSKSDFEMFLTWCLYNNYPEFYFHQLKVDEINKQFYQDYPEFSLRFRPHFKWKGNKVVKIGIRMSNEYCCMKKEERKELLKQYGLHLEKDVKSSVPRLTLSINKGEWIDEGDDIYELINKEFDPGSNFNEERREAIKHYFMRVYFEEGSDKLLGKNVSYKLDKTGLIKAEIDELMGRLRQASLKALGGKFYGNDIFYIESCVYFMTVYDLLASGHMVWLVYDAFYSNGAEDEETFKEMIKNSVKMNFIHFMEHSSFNENFKKARAVENKTGLSVKDIIEKYNKKA